MLFQKYGEFAHVPKAWKTRGIRANKVVRALSSEAIVKHKNVCMYATRSFIFLTSNLFHCVSFSGMILSNIFTTQCSKEYSFSCRVGTRKICFHVSLLKWDNFCVDLLPVCFFVQNVYALLPNTIRFQKKNYLPI